MREVGGLRLALLGLTTPPVYPLGHPLHRPRAQEVPVSEALAAARQWVPELRTQADLVVVLSHLGLRRAIDLASAVSGIDLIIGGHSHHRLPALLRIGATHIAQAGVNGAYLGVVTIEQRADGLEFTGRLEPVWQAVAPDPVLAAVTSAYLKHELPEMLAPVGEVVSYWADPWRENRWANFITDSLRAAAGTDVAFCNAGGIFPALNAGPTTLWDLWRCLPAMRANESMGLEATITMTLTGEEIRAV